MRSLVASIVVIAAGLLGGVLGWSAGLVMDRYRSLGLGPEEFWHTDPENVWAWGFIIGAAVGAVVGFVLAVRWLRRPARGQAAGPDAG
ncbi:MAG: hypothetical protein JSS02_09950 [Planctomycetes bacterium]|nr:hypothetical protein [Planctomycetota bacterium]